MRVGIGRETFPGERRVALVPGAIPALTKLGFEILLQKGAGDSAGFPNAMYQEKGARIVDERSEVFDSSDIILQVLGLGANPEAGVSDLKLFHEDQIIIGFLDPFSSPESIRKSAERKISAFAMELIPRTTRAQSMDALSSMATIAGYKAVLLAAEALPKMFPMLMTAAGTVTPAHVFVVGAGVAGLQAIATARRLGAVVCSYDIRPAVKEQVESLGAKFVELPLETRGAEDKSGYARAMDEEFYRKQRELMGRVLAENDVAITTAAVPGKKAPVLITEEMVKCMKPNSLIVDLAAERGGNCELTHPGETVIKHGVTIMGPLNLPTTVPYDASQMYAKNVLNFLLHLFKDGKPRFDEEDEIIRETIVTHRGEIVNSRLREILGLPLSSERRKE